MSTPFDQQRYQIRHEWGSAGLARLAPADVVVVVSVLGDAVPIADAAHATGAIVLLGGLRNASAVAAAVADEQALRGARTSVSVISAGEESATGQRFAVEDQFGAGAVIDALGLRGIDHTSPEAAAAAESYRGLGRAVRHLLTAGGTGQRLIADGRRDEVLRASELDVSDDPRVYAPALSGASVPTGASRE
ncbi:2-phosphosulfolactate phosphatase [Microbacterium xanthum]|uniref:2-phosphosulfolactate phosphatase n=1 Tax=Microbacterium xanthum TaxID=3079794 RepID=UPI002AD53F24|nr:MULTISPECIES: 2-phosphosulfolactate phosphatase [unclassified Microbacterium]MDZ8170568.1 2-phosphosulfolactate phosphatase [Microbacterium sp. KSW-48]MDZ8201092.1 2-phosphosulfolactate phosphatase [Microbacterium sp. SSW1-59]